MEEFGLRKGLYLSIGIHLTILILFSLIIVKTPFETITQPIEINLQSTALGESPGLKESGKTAALPKKPELPVRVTKSAVIPALPEKTLPEKKIVQPSQPIKGTPVVPNSTVKDLAKPPVSRQDTGKVQTGTIPPDTGGISEDLDKELESRENSQMEGDVDKALSDGGGKEGKTVGAASGGDPLGNAQWTSRARKTLFFPDLESKIPQEFKRKGIGYSVTARIAFDKNGLAVRVNILKSSGESAIDRVFNSELRKIRVESIAENRVDEVTKTFSISLK